MVIFLNLYYIFFSIPWDCLIFIEMKIVYEPKGLEHVYVLRLQYMLDTTLFCVSIYYDYYLFIFV